MTNKEWKEFLDGLNKDFQLTPYRKKFYNGKNGSIWYIANLNALCLIPSNVRQDDAINQLGLHNYELTHACDDDNEIIRGFAALYVRLFSNQENLLQIIEKDSNKRNELIETISNCLSDIEYDNSETIYYWQDTLKRENEKSLWKMLGINFENLKALYGLYMRVYFHIDQPVFEPSNSLFNRSKLVWLTEQDDFIERIDDIRIKQVLACDTYGCYLRNEKWPNGCLYASCFMLELLNYCCRWTMFRIRIAYGNAWDELETVHDADFLLAINHSMRFDHDFLAECFGFFNANEIYKTYLSFAYDRWKDYLERDPEKAIYADEEDYIWQEVYNEENEAFYNNKLQEILPTELYQNLEAYAHGLLRYIEHFHCIQPMQTSVQDTPELKDSSSSFLWPQYTTQATEEDKRDFERFLKRMCTEKTKSMTHDIHTYLQKKKDMGIIERPSQQNIEYQWVKQFGYPYQTSAYYKS